MARWLIVRHLDRVSILYENRLTGLRYACGQASIFDYLDDADVVAWIFQHGAPAPGEQVQLSDGRVLAYQASPASA